MILLREVQLWCSFASESLEDAEMLGCLAAGDLSKSHWLAPQSAGPLF